jgi:hypothetical protein
MAEAYHINKYLIGCQRDIGNGQNKVDIPNGLRKINFYNTGYYTKLLLGAYLGVYLEKQKG